MNKYTALGLEHAALNGRRILVVVDNMRATDQVMQILEEASDTTCARRLAWVNGQQSLKYLSGGSIHITSWRSSEHRGLTVDTIYLDAGVDGNLPAEARQNLMPAIAASPTGELITA